MGQGVPDEINEKLLAAQRVPPVPDGGGDGGGGDGDGAGGFGLGGSGGGGAGHNPWIWYSTEPPLQVSRLVHFPIK
jgi:hypothetical protein